MQSRPPRAKNGAYDSPPGLLVRNTQQSRLRDDTSKYGTLTKAREELSDDYTLINDFSISFAQPIHYDQAGQSIKSIQIDHLLISASGIFLIETKNWSKDSLNDWTMRSPVSQIRRASFALDTMLSSNPDLQLARHHWGERKIPIRNLVVLLKHKPSVEFENVKIVTLRELLGYVKFFEPSLSNEETKK
jgi:hypothetical protein